MKAKKKYPHYLPKGWTLEEVRKVAEYYDNQSDEEAAEEDEAMFHSEEETVMTVPRELVPTVRKLIAEYERKRKGWLGKGKRGGETRAIKAWGAEYYAGRARRKVIE